ncbi:MAG: hypothetical protein IPN34_15465 [Planctomycetes bacterium]|nr:hypothetical protein [Planctomycetota bacterium]
MTTEDDAEEREPRRPVIRGRRFAAREQELVTRDRVARVLGFIVGVGATAFFAFHRPRHRASRSVIPALVEVSPVAAWCVLAMASLVFGFALLRVNADELRTYWLTMMFATYAAVWVLRLILLLTA